MNRFYQEKKTILPEEGFGRTFARDDWSAVMRSWPREGFGRTFAREDDLVGSEDGLTVMRDWQ